MTVFQRAIVECFGFVLFIAVYYGIPCMVWLYICRRRDQKRGKKWRR